MITVIDVGCARYGGDYSLERLAEEFKPDRIFGFDPNWDATMPVPDGIPAYIYGMAAWTYDGTVGERNDGLYAQITEGKDARRQVHCMDLAAFITRMHAADPDGTLILKIDAEGSEYELLRHLIATETDDLLELVWVEWHDFGVDNPAEQRAQIEAEISCRVEEWLW